MRATTEDITEIARIKGELENELQERKAQVAILQRRVRSISNVLRRLGVEPDDPATRSMLASLRTVVRDSWGNAIANIDVDAASIRIAPAGSASIDTRKAPFRRFLVHRVLEAMRDKDKQAVLQGKLSNEDAIAFECREDEGMLVELVVHNYGTPQRLARIKDALNWTLGKQHAKRPHPT